MVLTAGIAMGFLYYSEAQLRRFYSLGDVHSYDTVNFSLNATEGNSFVRTVKGGNPLNIFGNPDLETINPSFSSEIANNACNVALNLNQYKSSSLGNGLVFAMFGGEKKEESANYWKLLINDNKVYNLDLNYGIGSSDIDLSGAAVKNLKIKTGSANIKLDYSKDDQNMIPMDTMMFKVDLGSIKVSNLHKASPKNVMAEIVFGNATIDFSNEMNTKCNVKTEVGAGSLTIILPKNTPTIIHLSDSPFCGLGMLKGFEQVEKNVYVNMSYSANAENLLTFDVDVSLGSVDFVYADSE